MVSMIFLLLLLVSSAYAQTGTISVNVTQIDIKKGGRVKIGIYDAAGFPVVEKAVAGIDLEVNGSSVDYVFDKFPVGKYAIAVFQDENMDNKLNKNLFGVPKEPYGFSKNKYGKLGPPDFEDVAFEVKENRSVSITIKLE